METSLCRGILLHFDSSIVLDLVLVYCVLVLVYCVLVLVYCVLVLVYCVFVLVYCSCSCVLCSWVSLYCVLWSCVLCPVCTVLLFRNMFICLTAADLMLR